MQEKEKAGPVKQKRHFWHKLLIYILSFFVATLIWLLVNYTIWRTEAKPDGGQETETAVSLVSAQPISLGYTETARGI